MSELLHNSDDTDLQPIVNPDEWEVSDEEIETTPGGFAVISVRFGTDALAQIRSAARAQGLTQAEFVRRAAEQVASQSLVTATRISRSS